MFRARLALVVALVAPLGACGGKSAPVSTVPLPADKPAPEPVADTKPPAPEEPEAPPEPLPPLDVKIAALTPTAKLVSAGKGKKSPLVYAHKVGAKQPVEIALDFETSAHQAGGDGDDTLIPTLVLDGDAETTAVAADGTATYRFTVAKASGRDVKGAKISVAEFEGMVTATLPGMTLNGQIGPTGVAGEAVLHVEKPDQMTEGAVELVKLTLPTWPVLPAEAVGVGAKWTVTSPAVLQGIALTYTTDYELVARKGTSWTVKGTTKVSGTDQTVQGSQISSVGGTGTLSATVTEGSLFPTAEQTLATTFTASQGGQSLELAYKSKGTFGVPTPPPPAPLTGVPHIPPPGPQQTETPHNMDAHATPAPAPAPTK